MLSARELHGASLSALGSRLAGLLLGAAAGVAPAQDAPVLLGGSLHTFERIDTPRAACFAPDGTILVLESGAGRVRRFGSDGLERASFGARGSGPGEMQRPAGLACAEDGTVWIADTGNHRLLAFDAEGRFLQALGGWGSEPGRFLRPTGIALHGEEIAVADTGNARVQVLDHAGKPLRSLREVSGGELARPVAVAFDPEGGLAVSDADLQRVYRFAPGENVAQRALGEWGWFPGQFSEPYGLALRPPFTYVVDRENHRVQVFDGADAFVHKFGVHAVLPREGQGKLHYPEGLCLAADGRSALVCEPLDDRVQWLGPASEADLEAARLREVAGQASPHFGYHIALSEPWLVVDEPETHSLVLYDLRLEEPVRVSKIGGWGDGLGFFRRPAGIVLDAPGRRLWVTDVANRSLQEVRLRGSFDQEVGFDAEMAVFAVRLRFDRMPLPKGTTLAWPIEPIDLARAEDGRFYVLDGRNEMVHVLGPDWSYQHGFGGHGSSAGRFDGPTALCWDGLRARLLVVDSGNRRVATFDAEGRTGQSFGEGVLDRPYAVVVDRSGRAIVSDSGRDELSFFDAEGKCERTLCSRGLGRYGLYKPRGLALDTSGRLYVIDHGNHRGMIYDEQGQWVQAFGSRFFTQPARSEGRAEAADEKD